MVKRICIIHADQSITILSGAKGEPAALAQGRLELKIHNKGERDPTRKAQLGEIEIDFGTFRERC